jgi:hypothetical protein
VQAKLVLLCLLQWLTMSLIHRVASHLVVELTITKELQGNLAPPNSTHNPSTTCCCRQVPQLSSLKQQAAANGVPDLQLLSGQEALDMEPGLRAVAALLSPSTGILDSHRCGRLCFVG